MKKNILMFTIISIFLSLLVFLMLSFFKGEFGYILTGVQHGVLDKVETVNLWEDRLKVIIISIMSGGALGLAGSLLQKVTKNNLADISIIGIGSINIIFITGYVLLFGNKAFGGGAAAAMLPVVTLFASVLGTGIVYMFSRSNKSSNNKFIIVGIAMQLLFEALAVVFVNPTKTVTDPQQVELLSKIKDYTVGMINQDTSWWLIITASTVIGIVFSGVILLRRQIDLIETNEDLATALGVKVERMKITIYILVALLAAAEAVLAGTIALLGILAPAIARKMFKNKTSLIAPASFLIGAILVCGASYISLTWDTQIPIGILSTTIVIPYFIYIIIRSN